MAPFIGQPGDDKTVPDQTPTVMTIPQHFRSHEAEDVDAISPAIRRSLKNGLRKWTWSNIHKVGGVISISIIRANDKIPSYALSCDYQGGCLIRVEWCV